LNRVKFDELMTNCWILLLPIVFALCLVILLLVALPLLLLVYLV
jgi:hypothetical protein